MILPPAAWIGDGAIPAGLSTLVVSEARVDAPEVATARALGVRVWVAVHPLARPFRPGDSEDDRRFDRTLAGAFATTPLRGVLAVDDDGTVDARATELAAFARRVAPMVDGLVISPSFRLRTARYGTAAREFTTKNFGIDLVDFDEPGTPRRNDGTDRPLPADVAKALRERGVARMRRLAEAVAGPFASAKRSIAVVVVPGTVEQSDEATLAATSTWREVVGITGVTELWLRIERDAKSEQNILIERLKIERLRLSVRTFGPASLSPEIVRPDE